MLKNQQKSKKSTKINKNQQKLTKIKNNSQNHKNILL
jgi:hypothetical protein